MARKRVHEIAKARGLTSKEVLAALHAAGIEAKAAASSVDEEVAAEALQAANGGGASSEASQPTPTEATPQAAPDTQTQATQAPQATPSQGSGDSGSAGDGPAPRPVRPVDGAQAAAQPGPKKRRRGVIDSQASRGWERRRHQALDAAG